MTHHFQQNLLESIQDQSLYLIGWPYILPIGSITAEAVAQAFVHGSISRFVIPTTLTTDHDQPIESSLLDKLMTFLGMR